MEITEIAKVAKASQDEVKNALVELKDQYDSSESSLILLHEGNGWKIAVREQFLPLVRTIVTETELPKTVLETLAVIAFKYPIKQSELIKIRTNKAYDHLKELEQLGYITRQKHSRTNLIKLTQKFFEYFDLQEEQLKEKFKDFQSIAHAIEQKENEVTDIKKKIRDQAKSETVEQQEARIQEEIGKLEEYDTAPETIIHSEKLGSLEIVDEQTEEELQEDRQKLSEIQQSTQVQKNESEPETRENEPSITNQETSPNQPETEMQELQKSESIIVDLQSSEEQNSADFEEEQTDEVHNTAFDKGKGIVMTQELEKIVNQKVERILHPPKSDNQEEDKNEPLEEKEAKDLLEAAMESKEKQKKQED